MMFRTFGNHVIEVGENSVHWVDAPFSPARNLCRCNLGEARRYGRHQWWQDAVFYEIIPAVLRLLPSLLLPLLLVLDSNNDGVGDLNGISSKMSYLHELGVDAIWITP